MKREETHKDPSKGDNAIKGVKNYLLAKGIKNEDKVEIIIATYGAECLEGNSLVENCEEIQRDFGAFVKWFKEYQNREYHD